MLKRLVLVLFAGILILLMSTQTVYAFNPFKGVCSQSGASASSACQNNGSDPISGQDGIIIKGARLVALITGIASVFVIVVWGGLGYITSTGDPAKVNKAKDAILYAVIGLVIAVLSEAIIAFLTGRL